MIAPTPGQAPHPETGRMSAAHYLLLIGGTLLVVLTVWLASGDQLIAALATAVLAIVLILTGAHGLGQSIRPAAGRGKAVDSAYPARLTGHIDPTLSRWAWLFKWLLVLPHYVVLLPLGIALAVVTVSAAFVILVTGRYPESLFHFVIGVFRWQWRVAFYGATVLATDKYPPFTLAPTDYPAELDVAYPTSLSRWRVLVKSWLFALPHLVIVTAVMGGFWFGMSLITSLVLVAAFLLLFTGLYRDGLFNLLMGINRWIFRTFVYVALLRDEYPPFRFDQGPIERSLVN